MSPTRDQPGAALPVALRTGALTAAPQPGAGPVALPIYLRPRALTAATPPGAGPAALPIYLCPRVLTAATQPGARRPHWLGLLMVGYAKRL